MANESSRSANTWITNWNFFDLQYYRSALNNTNIWRMDYHIARTFNNPKFSNDLLADLHGGIETVQLAKLPELTTASSSNPLHKSSISLMIDNILEALKTSVTSEPDRVLAYKGLAWFLLTTSLVSELDLDSVDSELVEYIHTLQNVLTTSNTTIMFQDLINLCGTRFSAEKSRNLIRSIVQTIM